MPKEGWAGSVVLSEQGEVAKKKPWLLLPQPISLTSAFCPIFLFLNSLLLASSCHLQLSGLVRELSPTQALTDCNHLTTPQEESSSSTRPLQPLSPAPCCCPNYCFPTNLRQILLYSEINSGQRFTE